MKKGELWNILYRLVHNEEDRGKLYHYLKGIGDITKLNTNNKNSLVDAINEIVNNIGNLESLSTEDKSSIINAINELVNRIDDIKPNEGLVKITYSELKELRNNAQLVPGTQYRITDYQCTTVQENTRSANHQFDIIVIADNESTLNENARAILHDGDEYFANCNLATWELKYCIDNNTDRFAWADTDVLVLNDGDEHWHKSINEKDLIINNIIYYVYSTDVTNRPIIYITESIDSLNIGDEIFFYIYENGEMIKKSTRICTAINISSGKGVIYYMKDEWNNECPYDFKNIMFERQWDSNTELWSKTTITSGVTSLFVYTFNDNVNDETTEVIDNSLDGLINNVYNNSIKSYVDIVNDTNKFKLNNICLFGEVYSNIIEKDCNNITFGTDSYLNNIGIGCTNCIFNEGFEQNIIGNGCNKITFDTWGLYNIIGNNCINIKMGYAAYACILKNDLYQCTIGENCYAIIIDNWSYNVEIGNACENITLGNKCSSNIIGESCDNITFGNGASYNKLASNSSGTPGKNFHNIIFDNGVTNCILYNNEEEGKVQNYHIKSSINYISGYPIAVERDREYVTTIAVNSSGVVKQYCEADLIN